jgi:hypothetical protein
MREFAKSFASLGLAMSLFAFKQLENIATPTERAERRGPAVKSLDAVTNATVNQLGETMGSAFRVIDNVQRGIIGLGFSMFLPFLGSNGSAWNSQSKRVSRGGNQFDRVISPPSRTDDPVVLAADLWPSSAER